MVTRNLEMLVEDSEGELYIKRYYSRKGNEVSLFLPLSLSEDGVTPYVKNDTFIQDENWDCDILSDNELYYKITDICKMFRVTFKFDEIDGEEVINLSSLRIRQLQYETYRGKNIVLKEVPMVVTPDIRKEVVRDLGLEII